MFTAVKNTILPIVIPPKRVFVNLATGISLVLCVLTCVLWVRSRSGYDQMVWRYDRWLPDRSAASTWVEFVSDSHLWVSIGSGRVGPPNERADLAWGYYINADESGGHPRLTVFRDRYDPLTLLLAGLPDGIPGWRPLRWQHSTRTAPQDGDDSTTVRFGMAHWLLVVFLLILPAGTAWRAMGQWHYRRAKTPSRKLESRSVIMNVFGLVPN